MAMDWRAQLSMVLCELATADGGQGRRGGQRLRGPGEAGKVRKRRKDLPKKPQRSFWCSREEKGYQIALLKGGLG